MKLGLNEAIRDHAIRAADWRHHAKAKDAYETFDAVNKVLFGGELPQALIGFDDVGRLKKAGEYYYEGDGISLRHHIDLRRDLNGLEAVVCLIHNAVHLHGEDYQAQETWYHANAFRDRMRTFGLVCDKNGDVAEIELPVFGKILQKLGKGSLLAVLEDYAPTEAEVAPTAPEPEPTPTVVGAPPFKHVASGAVLDVPSTPPEAPTFMQAPVPVSMLSWVQASAQVTKTEEASAAAVGKPKVKSPKPAAKMKKWSCACAKNIRAAVTINAVCVECGSTFELNDGTGLHQPVSLNLAGPNAAELLRLWAAAARKAAHG